MDEEERAMVAEAGASQLPKAPAPPPQPDQDGDADMEVEEPEDPANMKIVRNYQRQDPRCCWPLHSRAWPDLPCGCEEQGHGGEACGESCCLRTVCAARACIWGWVRDAQACRGCPCHDQSTQGCFVPACNSCTCTWLPACCQQARALHAGLEQSAAGCVTPTALLSTTPCVTACMACRARDGQAGFVKSPITGELVAVDQMAEHMRISLIDPKWRTQREAMLAKIRETTKASDDEIGRNLVGLARHRPDVFGEQPLQRHKCTGT